MGCRHSFIRPPEIATLGMLVVSSIGLAVNIFVAWYMHRGGDTGEQCEYARRLSACVGRFAGLGGRDCRGFA